VGHVAADYRGQWGLNREQANSPEHDFRFAWRRKSWEPWDWKLISTNQNEIAFDPTELP
jgi:hypothetical protein